MHHGQNRGKQKRKLSKNDVNWTKIGEMYKFCGNRGKFLNLWKYGKCAICIIGIEEMETTGSSFFIRILILTRELENPTQQTHYLNLLKVSTPTIQNPRCSWLFLINSLSLLLCSLVYGLFRSFKSNIIAVREWYNIFGGPRRQKGCLVLSAK